MTLGESTSILSVKNVKGGEVSVDMNALNECLCSLKEKSNVKIKDLKSKDKKNIKFFKDCVEKTYDTDSYFVVIQTVKRHFDHEREKYNVGTVGAYFTGCFHNTNHPNNSCTPACVNSFMPDKVPGATECKSLCIMVSEKGKFEALNATIIGNTTVSYIYFDSKKCRKEDVVTDNLKRYLLSKNIKQYNVMEYIDGESNGYKSVYGFVNLTTDGSTTSLRNKCSTKGMCVGGIFLIVIVVIIVVLLLLALFFGISYSKKE